LFNLVKVVSKQPSHNLGCVKSILTLSQLGPVAQSAFRQQRGINGGSFSIQFGLPKAILTPALANQR
jgi:hypothetical protein